MGIFDLALEWSTSASIVLAAVSFLLSIALAGAAVWGVKSAAADSYKTQAAKRRTEEEQHVLQLVKLATSINEAKDFDLQLAAISMLRYHPDYLPTLESVRLRFENRRAQEQATDGAGTLARLRNACDASIKHIEAQKAAKRPFWWGGR